MVLTLHVVKDRRQRVAYSALLPIATGGLPALMQLMELPTLQNLAFALYPLVGCSATIPPAVGVQRRARQVHEMVLLCVLPRAYRRAGIGEGLLLGDWNIAVTG